MRNERPIDLLLASAPLRRLPDVAKHAPAFERVWLEELKGESGDAVMPTTEAAKRLLRAALGVCEAAGIDGRDMVELFNDRLDAADTATPAELNKLIADMGEQLLTLMAAADNTKEIAR